MLTVNDLTTFSTATSASSAGQQLTNMLLWDATVTIVDTTPAAKTFVFASGNNFTIAAHGFLTGLKVVNSNSGGSLPTGLTGADEYVIVINANTVAFATSQANALAGTAIVISGPGTGVQTSTPQALVGALVVQKSNDLPGNNVTQKWFTLTTPTTAATQAVAAGSLNYYDVQCGYPYLRFLMTITSGQATASVKLNAKGQ